MAKATYTILVKINGKTLEGKSVKFKPGTPTREPQMSAGVVGRHFTVKPEPMTASVNVLHLGDFSVEETKSWENVTLVAECDNGLTYQSDGAYVTNSIEIGDEGGGVALEFAGPPAYEI